MTNHKNRGRVQRGDWPEYLRHFRRAHGNITQKRLADELEISLRCVEQWETAQRLPPPFLKKALLWLSLQLARPPQG